MAERVCPVWVGFLLASPLRKLLHPPERILAPHVRQGMTVLDIGSAMGFFSLPLARLVGPSGRVVCVDMQERMLRALEKRSRKAGLQAVVETRLCHPEGLGLEDLKGGIDFALACYVVHEVPDASVFFSEVRSVLRASGKMLVMEPTGHVSAEKFRRMVTLARESGFTRLEEPKITRSRSALLEKVSG
jgi:ubiquinone/menaquinone biosynthesis C-methylase UbiE